MGKEDLTIKVSTNYTNMFDNMFKSFGMKDITAQPTYLPFLMAGTSGAGTMPYIGLSMFYNGGNNGFMDMLNGFLSNISKSIEQITVSFSDITTNGFTSLNNSQNPPVSTQSTQIKKTNALSMLTADQIAATEQAAKEINCDPNDLIAIMYNESRLKPAEKNHAGSGNVGLIQFGKAAAKDLGTTQEDIAKMDYNEQLKYVVKYYKMVKSRLRIPEGQKIDGGTLYAMTFRPAYAGNEVLAQKGEDAYDKYSNYKLDIDNDNQITKKDLAYHVNKQKNELGLSA